MGSLNITVKQKLGDAPTIDQVSMDWFLAKLNQGYRAFSVNFGTITAKFMDLANLNIMPVFTWTINNDEQFHSASEQRLAGLITDDPERAVEVLNKEATCLDGDSSGNPFPEYILKNKAVAAGVGIGIGGVCLGVGLTLLIVFIRNRTAKKYTEL